MAQKAARQRYEVLSKIGEGALFTVYKAQDRVLNQPVAIKVLRPQFARNARFVHSMRRAAEVASKIPHLNVARTITLGEEEGTYFIATEFVRGENLEDKLATGSALSHPEAVRIAIQIAEALHYAHQNGIVHGDIRPHNVLINERGQVKVTDFTLAEAYSASPALQSDALIRTAPYLAPECADGAPATPASDLYALGITLYRMLTGALPFEGGSPALVASKHAEEPPRPPRRRNPAIPPALEAIVLKLLEKSPESRYQSAGHLIRDLRQVETGPHGAARATTEEGAPPGEPMVRPVRTLGYAPAAGEDRVPSPRLAPTHPAAVRRRPAPQASRPLDRSARLNTTLWIVIVSLAALLVIGLATIPIYFYVQKRYGPQEVRVPDIVGKPASDARHMLESLGLQLRETERVYDDRQPADIVLTADPEPGRKVKQGREVFVTVSKGPHLARVPNVTGMMLESARKLLEGRELKLGEVVEQFDDFKPKGEVVAQSPRAFEEVAQGTEVGVYVSKGARLEDPSNGLGATPEEATAPPAEPVEGVVIVTLDVPPGPSRQEVKIVVRDAKGEQAVYQQYHAPGDTVNQDVTVTVAPNKQATVKVFLAGTLVQQKAVSAQELQQVIENGR